MTSISAGSATVPTVLSPENSAGRVETGTGKRSGTDVCRRMPGRNAGRRGNRRRKSVFPVLRAVPAEPKRAARRLKNTRAELCGRDWTRRNRKERFLPRESGPSRGRGLSGHPPIGRGDVPAAGRIGTFTRQPCGPPAPKSNHRRSRWFFAPRTGQTKREKHLFALLP